MTGKLIGGVLAVFVGVVLLCAAGGAALFGTPPVPCPQRSAGASPAPVAGYQADQIAHAATIVAVGRQRGVPARGWIIAVATALQESSLRNLAGGDRDSVGLFQQRPSQGWGTPQQLRDPRYAAAKFYDTLLTVDGWQTMALTVAAQRVQRSAYPDAYAKWEADATRIVTAVTGDAGGCDGVISAQGWIPPVRGAVGSGFRTAERPSHDGVDIALPKGTRVHAVTGGVVSRVRCDAVNANTGAEWGCDRDGHPVTVRGCGWYLDIDHPGGIISRYCHLLARPTVQVGQHVTVGQVIGLSGNSGHSSGPHLHFEIHRGDHTSATAVDPVPFMASVGASLG
ncbi:M23 family metallopeptidase [Actinoplanes sp. NPDC024001]|uniref:M23 family metallopeptidase n=1 Tax=Actinoplanes sp. NPDC024001 TaxID=3154598 RepID=UPI0033F169C0